MQHYEDRSSMQEPGLCFVCETAPQLGVTDTLQNFTPGFPSSLSGRKYVCDGCVDTLAQTNGYHSDSQVALANERADEAVARYNAIRDHVARLTDGFNDDNLVASADAAAAPLVAAAAAVEEPVEAPVEEPAPTAFVDPTPEPEVVDEPSA